MRLGGLHASVLKQLYSGNSLRHPLFTLLLSAVPSTLAHDGAQIYTPTTALVLCCSRRRSCFAAHDGARALLLTTALVLCCSRRRSYFAAHDVARTLLLTTALVLCCSRRR
eukprot:6197006-Pleurochrysis_carterae.AAC.1